MWKLRQRSWGFAVALVFGIAVIASRAAKAVDFVLVNQTGFTLNQLYVSPCGGRHWVPNQLTGTYVESSRAFVVSNLSGLPRSQGRAAALEQLRHQRRRDHQKPRPDDDLVVLHRIVVR